MCCFYLESVFGQGLDSLHDHLLNPLHRQVTSCLLQTLAEEHNHLMARQWKQTITLQKPHSEIGGNIYISHCIDIDHSLGYKHFYKHVWERDILYI